MVGSNGQALVIAPQTGEVTSTVDLPGEPNGSPSVANGAIYMLMENGSLIKYR